MGKKLILTKKTHGAGISFPVEVKGLKDHGG